MARKRMTFDLEFTGLHKLTTPISLALVGEDGKEFYAEFTDFDVNQLDDFLREKVLTQLELNDYDFQRDYNPDADLVLVKGNTQMVRNALIEFFGKYEDDSIELWGDVNHYDWVVFISLFGTAFDKPKAVNYIPLDLATFLRVAGVNPDMDRHEIAEVQKTEDSKVHNSLYDARLINACLEKLLAMMGKGSQKQEATEATEETEKTQQAHVDEVSNAEVVQAPIIKEPQVANDGFVPPTQDMVNNEGEEWDAPM